MAAIPVLSSCGGGLSADAEKAYNLVKEQSDYCTKWADMVSAGVHQDDFGASWWSMNDPRIAQLPEVDVIAGGKKAVSEC